MKLTCNNELQTNKLMLLNYFNFINVHRYDILFVILLQINCAFLLEVIHIRLS